MQLSIFIAYRIWSARIVALDKHGRHNVAKWTTVVLSTLSWQPCLHKSKFLLRSDRSIMIVLHILIHNQKFPSIRFRLASSHSVFPNPKTPIFPSFPGLKSSLALSLSFADDPGYSVLLLVTWDNIQKSLRCDLKRFLSPHYTGTLRQKSDLCHPGLVSRTWL